MGASREKKARKELKQQQATTSGRRRKKTKKKESPPSVGVNIFAGIVITLVILGVAALVFNALRVPHRILTAVTVGGISVSPAEYDIYYYDTYYYLYYSWEQQELDPTDETYRDYFISLVGSQADSTLQNTVSLADLARKEGMQLDEDRQATLNSTMETLAETAKTAEKSVDRYLSSRYGAGVNRAVYEKYMTDSLLAEQWNEYILSTYEYSQSDYDGYYNENKDDVDSVTCRYFSIPVGEVDTEDPDYEVLLEEAQLEALAKVEEFMSLVDSEEAFIDAAVSFAPEESVDNYRNYPDDYTMVKNAQLSGWYDAQREWLVDPGRKEGDVEYFESADGSAYQIYYFLSRQRDEYYTTVDVRHILFAFQNEEEEEAATSSTYTDEQKQEAWKRAQEAYDRWKEGDANEDSFAELANELTDDPGNVVDETPNGGLYEGITMGDMVFSFEEWCFDADRKAGDTGLVETLYGVHLIYYVSHSENPHWIDIVRDSLLNNDMTEYMDDVLSKYPMEKKDFGMSFASAR